jgi:hypothetical protein
VVGILPIAGFAPLTNLLVQDLDGIDLRILHDGREADGQGNHWSPRPWWI